MFNVRIRAVRDSLGQDVLALASTASWAPPVQVGAEVSYTGTDGQARTMPYPLVLVMP